MLSSVPQYKELDVISKGTFMSGDNVNTPETL